MRSEVLAIFIVVLIVAAIGAFSVSGSENHQGASSTASTTTSGSTSLSSQGTTGTSLLILVLNLTTGQPVSGIRVIAGPTSSKNDAVYTPGGPTVRECVHQVPSGSSVLANGSTVYPNGTSVTFPPCPLSTYSTNSTGWVTISRITGAYYFFYAGNPMSSFNSFGIIQLFQGKATYVTVKAPSGNYTVTN